MDRIVFFTPSFDATGSEVALFNLLVQIKNMDVVVVSKRKGILFEQLPQSFARHHYETFVNTVVKRPLWKKVLLKAFGMYKYSFEDFLTSLGLTDQCLCYVNTIGMQEVVGYLQRRNVKFVLHAHELEQMLVHLSKQQVEAMIEAPDFVFTASETAKKVFTLLGRTHDMDVSFPAVDTSAINTKKESSALRAELGIPKGAFVLAMSGMLDVNKNPEGFLRVGKLLSDRGHSIHLLWIGVDENSGYMTYLRAKSHELGVAHKTSWINKLQKDDYYNHLDIADVFTLTSVKESFSIVIVEALALGKPVMSFMSGGPQEIINSLAIGKSVDTIEAMADTIEFMILKRETFDSDLARKRAKQFDMHAVFEPWFATLSHRYL